MPRRVVSGVALAVCIAIVGSGRVDAQKATSPSPVTVRSAVRADSAEADIRDASFEDLFTGDTPPIALTNMSGEALGGPPPAPAADSGVDPLADPSTYTPTEPGACFADGPCCCCPPATDWSKVPPARVFPRLGNFFIPPGGPGYYSIVDQFRGNCRDAPPKSGYPAFAIMSPGFFDADFRYLDAVPLEQRSATERLKRIHIGDDFLFSTGGEAWFRYANEKNSRMTQTNNEYGLGRVRTYGDLWYQDQARVFAEFIFADTSSPDLPPIAADINRGDFQNLFFDYKLFEWDEHPVYVRGGRQELLLGSQRLISPLAWANMRRNFDGVRVFRQGEKVDFDAFWVEPVAIDKNNLDSQNENQQFAGAWLTYRPKKGHFVDFYYLFFNNSDTVTQQGIAIAPSSFNTLGTRYAGDNNNFLWDLEAALQLGERGGDDIIAGMATVGAGYHFAEVRCKPTVWVYYDYASGDSSPNAGKFNTFNQLFTFGHYYLGWGDIVGRQNIQDLNLHLSMYPVNWLTVWLQYHHLWLSNSRDALYNVGGAAARRDPTGVSGNDVADEFDFVLNFHVDAQSDVMVAYAQVFGDDFLQNTATATAASSSQSLWLIYNFRW